MPTYHDVPAAGIKIGHRIVVDVATQAHAEVKGITQVQTSFLRFDVGPDTIGSPATFHTFRKDRAVRRVVDVSTMTAGGVEELDTDEHMIAIVAAAARVDVGRVMSLLNLTSLVPGSVDLSEEDRKRLAELISARAARAFVSVTPGLES